MKLFEKTIKQPSFGLFLTVVQRVMRVDPGSGLSLNEHLENGPNFIPPLYDVLVKFRCHVVRIIAHMEKAFHQIEIGKSNRDQIRCLWFDDVDNDNSSIVQFSLRPKGKLQKLSPPILGGTVPDHVTFLN